MTAPPTYKVDPPTSRFEGTRFTLKPNTRNSLNHVEAAASTGPYGVYDQGTRKLVAKGISREEAVVIQGELNASERERVAAEIKRGLARRNERLAMGLDARRREDMLEARVRLRERWERARRDVANTAGGIIDQYQRATSAMQDTLDDYLDPDRHGDAHHPGIRAHRSSPRSLLSAVGLAVANCGFNTRQHELAVAVHELLEIERDLEVIACLLGEDVENEAGKELGIHGKA
jgi:hypothetical protein